MKGTTLAVLAAAAIGVSAYTDDFCGSQPAKRQDYAYVGNIGTEGNYACNLKLVEKDVSENYQFLSRLTNGGSEAQKCICFLKIGPDGVKMDGFWSPNKAFDFDLAPGETKYMAAQRNTQGGCTCGAGSIPLTPIGQYAGTWYEFDFYNEENSKDGIWSGADASSLVAHDANVPFQGLTITSPGLRATGDGTSTQHDVKSVIYPDGNGCNAFPAGRNAEHGFGFNIRDETVRLNVEWGTQGTIDDCPDIAVGGKTWRQPV